MADEKKNGNGKMSGSHGMTCDCASGCGCTCHGGMGGGRHWTFSLLRTLLTILILMIVFWFGVTVARIGDGYFGRTRFEVNSYGTTGMRGAMPMIPYNGSTTAPTTTGGVQNY